MLVLLIIFLITIPVVTHTVPVAAAEGEQPADADQAAEHHHRVDKDGDIFWNEKLVGYQQRCSTG